MSLSLTGSMHFIGMNVPTSCNGNVHVYVCTLHDGRWLLGLQLSLKVHIKPYIYNFPHGDILC